MFWKAALILMVLWLLGLASGYRLGGLIHVLPLAAIAMMLFDFLSGRKQAPGSTGRAQSRKSSMPHRGKLKP